MTRPTSGDFSINDFTLQEDAIDIRRNIGMISHSPFLYDEMTAYENILFYGKMFNVDHSKLKDKVKSLLRIIGLVHRTHDRVGTFSRGMKQRVSIARAVIHEPKVLFLDEPYTGLDQNAAAVLNNILKDFKQKKGTIVMVTHDLERGLKLSDRIAILNNKRIVHEMETKGLTLKKLKVQYKKYSQ